MIKRMPPTSAFRRRIRIPAAVVPLLLLLAAAAVPPAAAEQRTPVPVGTSPSIGRADAPVTIVEFVDYQ